jgi:outer membrane protein assembly factor BamB
MFAFLLGSASHLFAQGAGDAVTFGPDDWPWWRGPNRNGIADARQKPPTQWSETDGILWKTPIPGRGHGSPIVVGDQIFLATAEHDKQLQSVLCFDRNTGKQLWQTVVHEGKFEKGGNGKASLASATAACDGRRVFITFLHDKAIYATALSLDGKKLWQTRVTGFVLHQGYGPSPTVYKSLVLVTADNKGTGLIAGLDRATGSIVWKQERPKWPNYASPIIINTTGRDELILTGCERIASYDPLTGKPNWDFKGTTQETVTSIVTDGEHIFTSGGYPKQHVSAIKADGSGQIVWEIKTQVYVPSMLVHDKHLYAVTDGGTAVCWKCATGAEVWKKRLNGAFTASPVLVGDQVYATNEDGTTFIFKATPKGYEEIAQNQLGDEALATPTICGGRIYVRVATRKDGKRQESLNCIGK